MSNVKHDIQEILLLLVNLLPGMLVIRICENESQLAGSKNIRESLTRFYVADIELL